MRKSGTLYLLIGLSLFTLSFYPLFIVFRELILDYYVNLTYKVQYLVPYDDPKKYNAWYKEPILFKNQVIQITDQGKALPRIERDGTYGRDWQDVNELRVRGAVAIKINGLDVSWPSELVIRPDSYNTNRYWGWLNMIQVNDEIAIIQRISPLYPKNQNFFQYQENQKWRILYVNQHGGIREDIFTYGERGNPPIRAKIVHSTTVAETAVGYKSDILNSWPTFFFPFVYPLVTAGIGTILLIVGIYKIKRRGTEQ